MFLFFFSSRRRHTRFKCDWSSDVCSSDLTWRDEEAVVQWRNVEAHLSAQRAGRDKIFKRSEEHTSELQSHLNLVCRLLLEKKSDPHAAATGWPLRASINCASTRLRPRYTA